MSTKRNYTSLSAIASYRQERAAVESRLGNRLANLAADERTCMVGDSDAEELRAELTRQRKITRHWMDEHDRLKAELDESGKICTLISTELDRYRAAEEKAEASEPVDIDALLDTFAAETRWLWKSPLANLANVKSSRDNARKAIVTAYQAATTTRVMPDGKSEARIALEQIRNWIEKHANIDDWLKHPTRNTSEIAIMLLEKWKPVDGAEPTPSDVAVEHIETPRVTLAIDDTWPYGDYFFGVSIELLPNGRRIITSLYDATPEERRRVEELVDGVRRGDPAFSGPRSSDTTDRQEEAGEAAAVWPKGYTEVAGIDLGSPEGSYTVSVTLPAATPHDAVKAIVTATESAGIKTTVVGPATSDEPEREPGDVWCNDTGDATTPESEACNIRRGTILSDQHPGSGVPKKLLRCKHCWNIRTEPAAEGDPEPVEAATQKMGSDELPALSEEMQTLARKATWPHESRPGDTITLLAAIRHLEANQLNRDATCGDCGKFDDGECEYGDNEYANNVACVKIEPLPTPEPANIAAAQAEASEPEKAKARFFRGTGYPGNMLWVQPVDGPLWSFRTAADGLGGKEHWDANRSFSLCIQNVADGTAEEITEAEALRITTDADWPEGLEQLRKLIGGSDA